MNSRQFIYEIIENPFLVALHKVQDKIYGLQLSNNTIMGFDTQNKELRYEGRIPGVDTETEKAFGAVISSENLHFFIPFRESDLYIYDSKEERWSRIDLNLHADMEPGEELRAREVSQNMPGRFYGGCMYRDMLFLFPFGYRGIVRYNTVSGEVFHCADFNRTILKKDAALFHNYAQVDETHIALSCLYSNHIVFFDLESNEIEIKTAGKADYRFSTIIKYNDTYWLVVKNRLAFIKWNPDSNQQKEYTIFPPKCKIVNDKHCFDDSNIYLYNGHLYCFPAGCNMAVKVNLCNGETMEIESLTPYCQDERLDRHCSTFDGGILAGNKIYLHYQLQSILVFDLDTEEIYSYERKIRDMDSIKKMSRVAFDILKEVVQKGIPKGHNCSEHTVGETVYDTISKLIL